MPALTSVEHDETGYRRPLPRPEAAPPSTVSRRDPPSDVVCGVKSFRSKPARRAAAPPPGQACVKFDGPNRIERIACHRVVGGTPPPAWDGSESQGLAMQ